MEFVNRLTVKAGGPSCPDVARYPVNCWGGFGPIWIYVLMGVGE